MKTHNIVLKLLLFIILPLAFLQLFSSCSKSVKFENSNVIPAARGAVDVRKG
jgi:hypothetical protein